jgi:hypothetical protein
MGLVVAAHGIAEVEPVRLYNKSSGSAWSSHDRRRRRGRADVAVGLVAAHGVAEVEPVRPYNKSSSGAWSSHGTRLRRGRAGVATMASSHAAQSS